MARPRIRANFFVTPSGVVIPKARPLSSRQRYEVFERDGHECQACGRAVVKHGDFSPWTPMPGQVDHIFPRSRGGQNDERNLRLLCWPCNGRKGTD